MFVEILLIALILLAVYTLFKALWTGSIKAPGKGYIRKHANSRSYWAIVILGIILLADFVFIFIYLLSEK